MRSLLRHSYRRGFPLGTNVAETGKQFSDTDDLWASASAYNDVRDLPLGRLPHRKRPLSVNDLCGRRARHLIERNASLTRVGICRTINIGRHYGEESETTH